MTIVIVHRWQNSHSSPRTLKTQCIPRLSQTPKMQYSALQAKRFWSSPKISFASRSALFPNVGAYVILYSSLAAPCLTIWWAMLIIFFFRVESSIEVLCRIVWLSLCVNAGPSQGVSIIYDLYLKPLRYS